MVLKPKVIIIGGGFGGLKVANTLQNEAVDITLIDQQNHHLFQPLLYQVATSTLSPANIAYPLRAIFKGKSNVNVVMAHVQEVNADTKTVKLSDQSTLSFDYLVVATGARHSYFGRPEWETHAVGLKTLRDALSIREKILLSFEKAERLTDKNEQQKQLTFIIVGGGPTGVEMAGAVAEMAKQTITGEFRHFDSSKDTRILLVEAQDRVLMPYDKDLSEKAKKSLEKLGVEVHLHSVITDITADGAKVGDQFIPAANVIWAAGNMASPLLKTFVKELDRAGRALVESTLNIKGHDSIFCIGDCAHVVGKDGQPLPGIAPVALQEASYVSKRIKALISGKKPSAKPFSYFDRGKMATIGRGRAIAESFGLKFSGILAWILWSFIHIFFLIDFRNKIYVSMEWLWYLSSQSRHVRLISRQKTEDEYRPK